MVGVYEVEWALISAGHRDERGQTAEREETAEHRTSGESKS